MSQSMNAMLAWWRSMLPSLIIQMPLWLWWLIVRLKSLGEVHQFSAWRALGASLIGLLLFLGIMLVAVLVFGAIIRIFAVIFSR